MSLKCIILQFNVIVTMVFVNMLVSLPPCQPLNPSEVGLKEIKGLPDVGLGEVKGQPDVMLQEVREPEVKGHLQVRLEEVKVLPDLGMKEVKVQPNLRSQEVKEQPNLRSQEVNKKPNVRLQEDKEKPNVGLKEVERRPNVGLQEVKSQEVKEHTNQKLQGVKGHSNTVQDKGRSLQPGFAPEEIAQDVERSKNDETQEKEEKDREKWKTKYVVTKDEEGDDDDKEEEEDGRDGGNGVEGEGEYVRWKIIGSKERKRKADQNAGPVPTRLSGFDRPHDHRVGHPPSARSSGMIITLQYYFNFIHFYLPKNDSVNTECRRDLKALGLGIVEIEQWIKKGMIWPLKMIDSWGKTADGLLEGNINFMGFFEECINIYVRQDSPRADFQGKYCTITYKHLPGNASLHDQYHNWHSLKMPFISAASPGMEFIPYAFYATCMPSTCKQQELRDSIAETFNQSLFEIATVECQTKDQHHDLKAGEIFGIVFFSIIGIILLSASLIDVWVDFYPVENVKNGPLRYLLVFSVPRNLNKLFHIDTGRKPDVVSCLHGMRFLSICWVVLGHQYAYSATLSSNIAELPKMTSEIPFQMVANGDVSVDTFFFMSGLLVCLTLMRQMKRTGTFNARVFYVHRIVRLLPPIAMTCAFMATLSTFLVKGPLAWYYEGFLMKGCRHSWWMDVSFVSNFVFQFLGQMHKENEAATCLPHCWYTAVDMQLYLITPLIVLPMYYWEKKGVILLAFWTIASVVIPASITGAYDLWPANMLIQDPAASQEYSNKIYVMPWCRAGPYIVGIAIGYVLYIAKESPSITRLSKSQVVTGWLASTAVALSIVFGISKYNKVKLPGTPPVMSIAEAVLYGGFHRTVWAVVMGWIVLACHWGYGGPVNWILAHPIWQPLSRLTYCIYITSLPIQLALLTTTVRLPYYSHLTKIEETCGVLLITIGFSIVLTLISEGPILGLEKIILQPYAAIRRPPAASSSHNLTVGLDEKSDGEDSPDNGSNIPA